MEDFHRQLVGQLIHLEVPMSLQHLEAPFSDRVPSSAVCLLPTAFCLLPTARHCFTLVPSTGYPAFFHTANPPSKAAALSIPLVLSSSTAPALVCSFCQVQ